MATGMDVGLALSVGPKKALFSQLPPVRILVISLERKETEATEKNSLCSLC